MLHELTSNPLFGLVLSIAIFLGSRTLAGWLKWPIFNPLIVSIVAVIAFLKITGITYDDYYVGGSILNMLIAPATVALAIPLYKSFHLLKHHARSIVSGIILGSLFSTLLTTCLAVLFKYDKSLVASILPRSVTTAIAIEISSKMDGITTVTIIVVIITGIIGAITGPSILRMARVDEPVAKGVALGTSAHAIGTARAMELGTVEGAMSGLAIGVTGVVTVFIAPMMLKLFFLLT
ncbi:LrgB family protein [Vagococcus intermedius]|uniref:LrgB family protein n=1 Tax=Vagococcus intermedius TaxID=2991418 RepID=A0AAF0CV07_9ENTE|nr:LrgB family protein [Vagococcus intermedius]WEG73525.1 LrgB family protein [Vagococcus intermedius]WEG75607.1 LrgB family protein [Vagococcus intermedius]